MPENPKVQQVNTAAAGLRVNALRNNITDLQKKIDDFEAKMEKIATIFDVGSVDYLANKVRLVGEIRDKAKELYDFAMANLQSVDSADLGDITKIRFGETRRTRVVTPKSEKSAETK